MKSFYALLTAIFIAATVLGCKKSEPPAPAPLQGLPALQQAVKDYNTKEGHNPKSLDDLVPNYIAKIPDAHAGYKFAYDPNTGTVNEARN
jgi:hypothetical protein